MSATFNIPPTAQRRAADVELQGMLVDLLDLTLIGQPGGSPVGHLSDRHQS